MKTIFLSIYDGDTEKNILRTSVWQILLQSGHRIVLLVRGESRIDYYRKEFGSSQVAVELLQSANSFQERIWYYIGWNSIPTRAISVRRYREWWSKGRYLHGALGAGMWLLGHVRPWRNFLRLLYYRFGEDYAVNLFDRYKPDLLFSPNMFSPEDMRLLLTAKRRGIPTITTVKSWDVLPTKAFTRVKADRLLVFNEFNRDEACAYGDYDSKKVTITGFPQFDLYKHTNTLLPREEFCRKAGLDPNKRFVLFGIPGDWKSPFSKNILNELDSRISAGAFKRPLQVLARLHPKYRDSSEGMQTENIVFERPGKYFKKKGEFGIDAGVRDAYSWTFDKDDLIHLANSIHHADLIICTDSTLTLDAAANDRATVLIGYDGDVKLPYKKSIAFIYERDHYARLLRTGAVPIAHSHDELVELINTFLVGSEYLRTERESLKGKLLYKNDDKAGERVAAAVLDMLA